MRLPSPRQSFQGRQPSLFQAPTGDGGLSRYGKPRPSFLLGLAQQENRQREREESLGATGRREAPG